MCILPKELQSTSIAACSESLIFIHSLKNFYSASSVHYQYRPTTMVCGGQSLEKCPLFNMHSFIHSGHFYSAPSSPILLRGAPDYSTDTVSEFHAEAYRQL